MRPPSVIKAWQSIDTMFQWLQEAKDQETYKRRMAIWLTYTGKLHAHKVAEILEVSVQAVWTWIGQYNQKGPKGLDRIGRGGRRWGFMSLEEESELLKSFFRRKEMGRFVATAMIKEEVERRLGRAVSTSYLYRFLRRHEWFERITILERKMELRAQNQDFRRLVLPWKRRR